MGSRRARLASAVLLALLAFPAASPLAGCGFLDAGNPIVLAHRAGKGNWPENSRTAVRGSIAAGYPGIEMDVVLTRDLVPFLFHDVALNAELCTRADGSRFEERILIRDLTAAELEGGFLCGGLPDPEAPDAERVAEPVLSLDELLALLADAPGMAVYLDTKYDPATTPPAEDFAREVMTRWEASGIPNTLYVESTFADGIRAFEAQTGGAVTTLLGWPRFPEGSSTFGVAIGNELASTVGARSGLGLAKDAGADGLSMPFELVDFQVAEATRDEGLLFMTWTMNGRTALRRYCRFPADAIMTDYPERAPCL